MSIDTVSSNSEAMSNQANFSYAQAAKGQSTSQPAGNQTSATPSHTTSPSGTQNRDVTATSTRAPSVAGTTASNEVDAPQHTRTASIKPDSLQSVDQNGDSKVSHDDTAATASVAESVSSSKVGEKSNSETASQPGERRGRGPYSGSNTVDGNEGRKARKGKKGKPTEKDSETTQDSDKKETVAPKLELSEAPIPTVNIWAQRREQQAAKVQATSSTATQARATSSSNTVSAPAPADTKQKVMANEGMDMSATYNRSSSNGTKGFKKDGEPSRNNGQGPRRAGPRGSRPQGKEDRVETLSSVDNSASWPTPDTAADTQKTQSKPEKSERPEKEEKEEDGPSKSKKTEWTPMTNFVPSVLFNTPLPGRNPRGGRAGGPRGGRDGMTGNGPSTSNAAERGQDIVAGGRTAKRGSVDASLRDQRKHGAQVESAKASREPSMEKQKTEALKGAQNDMPNGPSAQHPPRPLRVEDGVKVPETQKETRPQGHKDGHYQGQNGNNRSGDRTRGGGRARGAYTGANNATNGMPHHQSSFSQGYPFSGNGGPRQGMSPYGPGYPQMPYNAPYMNQHGAGPRRPGSGPMGPGRSGPRHARGSSMMQAPMYDGAMYPGNGAMPMMDPTSLLSLVTQQVEYYFSVENLCKDMYLRRKLDSQGFVPLEVIASFNRMKQILSAGNFDVLRMACEESSAIDFVIGDDGVERIRKSEAWQMWVFGNMEDRDPEARHNGPTNYHRCSRTAMHQYYNPMMMGGSYGIETPVFSPTGVDPHFAHYMNNSHMMPPMHSPITNGINGQVRPADSQLSATVPEFSPSAPTGFTGQPSMMENGIVPQAHNLEKAIEASRESTHGHENGPLPNGASHSEHPVTNGVNGDHKAEGQ
ncbi:hypothetical protein F5Y15DRAFT_77489 [Xylariaceae sp. FL0016]|nr:hypothetical protein F5Y15DRAFT_77489 [Xylariaceae sp. FL0016]